ncbi:hypothetical protein B566_EDAN015770 [Ephemera danica]|nr:hypothetical protein B566_EDAN015770 [Ephemera danica]
MTAERCGLGSLLPVSCRGRAEAFARRLQSRLRSLGRGEGGEEEGTSGEEQLLGGGWSAEDGAVGGWGAAGPACSTHNKQPLSNKAKKSTYRRNRGIDPKEILSVPEAISLCTELNMTLISFETSDEFDAVTDHMINVLGI